MGKLKNKNLFKIFRCNKFLVGLYPRLRNANEIISMCDLYELQMSINLRTYIFKTFFPFVYSLFSHRVIFVAFYYFDNLHEKRRF